MTRPIDQLDNRASELSDLTDKARLDAMAVGGFVGFRTLLYKEVLRFWKVAFQTVAAPVLTAAWMIWFTTIWSFMASTDVAAACLLATFPFCSRLRRHGLS